MPCSWHTLSVSKSQRLASKQLTGLRLLFIIIYFLTFLSFFTQNWGDWFFLHQHPDIPLLNEHASKTSISNIDILKACSLRKSWKQCKSRSTNKDDKPIVIGDHLELRKTIGLLYSTGHTENVFKTIIKLPRTLAKEEQISKKTTGVSTHLMS